MDRIQHCILIGLMFCAPAFADEWTGRDKALHFIGGGIIGAGVTLATDRPLAGFAAGCAAGAAKEWYDRNHAGHTASTKDFVVTCLGAALGAAGAQWAVQRVGRQTVVSYNRTF